MRRMMVWLWVAALAALLWVPPDMYIVQTARAGQQPQTNPRCARDADCILRPDRAHVCENGYCQPGCRDDAACERATGNRNAYCAPVKGCKTQPCRKDCVIPAWGVP